MEIKESIHIEHVGPIVDVHIPDVRPLTVLIGESAGGKSTIMKVLVLCRWLYKMYNFREYLRLSGISKSPFRFRMDAHLEYAGLLEYVGPRSKIQYTVSFGDGMEPFHVYVVNKSMTRGGKIPGGALGYRKLCYITETRGFVPNMLSSKSLRPKFDSLFEEMVENFEQAYKFLPELAMPCLGVNYFVERAASGPKHYVSSMESVSSPYKIEYRHSSSGIQNTVPVLLLAAFFSRYFDLRDAFNKALLTYLMGAEKLTDFKPVANPENMNKNVFLHLEEPELGLFPDAQCGLMNELVKYCFSSASPMGLILTTHSPYILNHLNLLIQAHDKGNVSFTDEASLRYEDVAVYHVDAGGIEDLKDFKSQRLINTNVLSDTMNDIYNRYEGLAR